MLGSLRSWIAVAGAIALVDACGDNIKPHGLDDDGGVEPDGASVDGIIDGSGAGDGGDVDATQAIDAAIDAAGACGLSPVTWRLEEKTVTGLAHGDRAPVNVSRSTRFLVTVKMQPSCEEPAMLVFTPDALKPSGRITAFTFKAVGKTCPEPAVDVVRPIVVHLPTRDVWAISAGEHEVRVNVALSPAPACTDTPNPTCARDCQCATTRGEVCLGNEPGESPLTTRCVRPCEYDRDCGGQQCLGEVAVGPDHVCAAGAAECGEGRPECPAGHACTAGVCTPEFVLGEETRHPCTCDAECAKGLRCVESATPGQVRRCEVVCPTSGPWCGDKHACGAANKDSDGLAASDSVCGARE